MTTIRTLDRTLALRCKRAYVEGRKISVSHETPRGWSYLTGIVQSVRRLEGHRFRPCWEITIVEQK